MNNRLTKSNHKIGISCPRKLYYHFNKNYPNRKQGDSFMQALAAGGGQVGELAKFYYGQGKGVDITEKNHAKSLEQTKQEMEKDKTVIYEAAIEYKNLFIRVDVLKKEGKTIDLIEVKAKSFDGCNEEDFIAGKDSNKLHSNYWEYVYDIAFQTYVTEKAYPGYVVRPYLMFADKNAIASVDGLNQLFRIGRDEKGYTRISTPDDLKSADLGDEILIAVKCDSVVRDLIAGKFKENNGRKFVEEIEYLSDLCESGEKGVAVNLSKICKKCEFRATAEELEDDKKCGYTECVSEYLGIPQERVCEPNIFDIWYSPCNKLYDKREIKKYFMTAVDEADITVVSRRDRQLLQIRKTLEGDDTAHVDIGKLEARLSQLKYPFHFIDFETSMVAIPFSKGRRPYENIVFQYSHHQVDKDGTIEHKDQYLHCEPGEFPNFHFLRDLKSKLDNDDGDIFMYSSYENSVLKQIRRQLDDSDEPDKDELMAWVEDVTTTNPKKKKDIERWVPSRPMIDLREIIMECHYYNPLMKGSISIKDVLPALLSSSDFLRDKYSKSIYGAEGGMKSLSFVGEYANWTWIDLESGLAPDPYKSLPPLFPKGDECDLSEFISDTDDDQLAEGGAAMMAYARMQFTEMTDEERMFIRNGLLRYCELDTLAMVMIWEGLKNLVFDLNDCD